MSSTTNTSPALPGLYVHIPFCASRCRYCSFVSNLYDMNLVNRYLDALHKELAYHTEALSAGISTLFIGGGTPNILTLQQITSLLSRFQKQYTAEEFTIECNPDSLSREKLSLFYQYGVNRLSIGAQTFDPDGLQLLGRRHTADAAKKAITHAFETGFTSVSLDLIIAWPGQTQKMLIQDIKTALSLGITHISCYNLIVEEDTAIFPDFASGALVEKTDDEAREFWDISETYLMENGFDHYEISNFAKPGKQCKHNVNCWKGLDYIGIGAAAHSHWRGARFANHAPLESYLACLENNQSAKYFNECLDREAKAREGATLWLRMKDGINIEEFAARFGISIFDLYPVEVSRLLDLGLLELQTAKEGKLYLHLSAEAYPNADLVLVDLV